MTQKVTYEEADSCVRIDGEYCRIWCKYRCLPCRFLWAAAAERNKKNEERWARESEEQKARWEQIKKEYRAGAKGRAKLRKAEEKERTKRQLKLEKERQSAKERNERMLSNIQKQIEYRKSLGLTCPIPLFNLLKERYEGTEEKVQLEPAWGNEIDLEEDGLTLHQITEYMLEEDECGNNNP